MTWNWQQPERPNFSWGKDRLTKAEDLFLISGGVLIGSISHLTPDGKDQLAIEAMSAGKYVAITGAATATATRDLADMVAKGALPRRGERRHARYHLAVPPKPVC